jgi:glyoxylase-like metal-dependent hydrolase (beta-lactamase superfamily II)
MANGVSPSRLASQPIGEAARVADDIYQLKVPVPIPLKFVSAYLIADGDGWTLIDTGFDYPDGRAVWEEVAGSLGCDLDRGVTRILVTHFHPDHLGAARWLQERSGAPVYMLESEIPHAREVWGGDRNMGTLVEHLVRHGMDRELAETAGAKMRARLALPEVMLPLRPGEELTLGAGTARVLHAPGHADHQYLLYDEGRRILFAADQVLLKITPNVGLWPETKPRPLARFMESLSGMRGMAVDLVLPGHGPVFHDLDGRISELLSHHEHRLEVMRRALEGGPRTSFEVSRKVFRGDLSLYEHCFALAETLAHLEHLVLECRAERIEDGTFDLFSFSGFTRTPRYR